jgi:hypothetical protein
MANVARAKPENRCSARAQVALVVMGIRVPNALELPTQLEMSVARKNGVGLEYASHFPNAAAILTEEKGWLADFLGTLEETSESFQAAEIPHILIKHKRQYRYYDSNVDVVVSRCDWNRAVQLLHSCGYSGNVMFKEPDKIMFDRPAKRISVHLHPGVTWNGVPYVSTESLWSNSRAHGNGFRRELSDEFELLVNVGHILFENYEVTLGELLYCSRDLQEREIDVGRLACIARANNWGWGFQQLFDQVKSLANNWNIAAGAAVVPRQLLNYPYQLSPTVLARTYARRIVNNARDGHLRRALREVYAYPTFYALKRRHDLPGLRRL